MKKIIGLIVALVSVICFTTAHAADTIKVPARFTACTSPVSVYLLMGAISGNDTPFAFNLFKLGECAQFDAGTEFEVIQNPDMTGHVIEIKQPGSKILMYTHPSFSIFTKTRI